jgi:hypothetical protein
LSAHAYTDPAEVCSGKHWPLYDAVVVVDAVQVEESRRKMRSDGKSRRVMRDSLLVVVVPLSFLIVLSLFPLIGLRSVDEQEIPNLRETKRVNE